MGRSVTVGPCPVTAVPMAAVRPTPKPDVIAAVIATDAARGMADGSGRGMAIDPVTGSEIAHQIDPESALGIAPESASGIAPAPSTGIKTTDQGQHGFAIATIEMSRYGDRRRSGDERRQPSQRSRSRYDESRSQRPDAAPEAAAATPPADDLIWGRHATQAALEAGRPIHRIWCTAEMRSASKFLQLLRDAKASGVLVEEVTWARLGQITGGSVHQGIALQTAAAETLDLDSLIEGCSDLGEPPCWWPWTVSPIRTTLAPLFAPLRRWEPTGW